MPQPHSGDRAASTAAPDARSVVPPALDAAADGATLAAFADDPTLTPARLAAAGAVRRLVHSLVGHQADDGLLERVAATADELVVALGSTPRRLAGDDDAVTARFAEPKEHGATLHCFSDCMVAGPANPLSAVSRGYRDGAEAVLEVRLQPGFEGLPGRSHGGIVASLFDEVMGYALYMDAIPAFTAWLRVDYRAPVPIEEPIELRAKVRERDGRKCYLVAAARHDGEVVAEAEALFVTPR